jgi:Chaperone of endosialidase
MSWLSDLFGGANNAAQAQIAGIQAGLGQATGDINQGSQALNTNFAAALAPFTQNYGQAQQGVAQLGNVLGLNGPGGTQKALTTLQTTPGYQFALGQGLNATNAQGAATGQTGSGNEALALQSYGTGLADQTYNNYVGQLQPYLQSSNAAASGIGNVNTGLGTALNANFGNLANLNYGAQTSIGNANASADLANQSLGLGLLGGGLGLGASLLGGGGLGSLFGGGSLSGLNSLFSGGFGGYTASDERLKDDIEPVGELYDGQKIFRYTYIDDPVTTHIGLIAQDVADKVPDAVRDFGGFLAVDYKAATNAASDLARFLDAA